MQRNSFSNFWILPPADDTDNGFWPHAQRLECHMGFPSSRRNIQDPVLSDDMFEYLLALSEILQ